MWRKAVDALLIDDDRHLAMSHLSFLDEVWHRHRTGLRHMCGRDCEDGPLGDLSTEAYHCLLLYLELEAMQGSPAQSLCAEHHYVTDLYRRALSSANCVARQFALQSVARLPGVLSVVVDSYCDGGDGSSPSDPPLKKKPGSAGYCGCAVIWAHKEW